MYQRRKLSILAFINRLHTGQRQRAEAGIHSVQWVPVIVIESAGLDDLADCSATASHAEKALHLLCDLHIPKGVNELELPLQRLLVIDARGSGPSEGVGDDSELLLTRLVASNLLKNHSRVIAAAQRLTC
jgi:hypothetical protein